MKIIVWGTGQIAGGYLIRRAYHVNDEIIAFTDNNKMLWGQKYENYTILAPDELCDKEFDRLVICTIHYEEIEEQIQRLLDIDQNKVITYFEVEEETKRFLINKYKDSSDSEIQKVVGFYKVNPLNVFGYYEGDNEVTYPVFYESDGMPYIWFENKKMYYPMDYDNFVLIDGRKYVMNVMYEQGEHSPHRYVQSDNFTGENMVIVDAGVCEGNFALRYVEHAKKIYLIESDKDWMEALHRTFKPYVDKVVFCSRFLSGEDSDTTITLDTLISEKIDFLKMDIEGYEREALRGGSRVLSESIANCAICSYHRHGDEAAIRGLLEDYGYHTDVSEGYMFFPFDTELEFRKGVVYGRKES
ncbi:MAG: FkbM family methyltransferase [Lachnospiraceae bacterium]|nr:FkbM family methyltransferase [Lachnospiraceae bacterium]